MAGIYGRVSDPGISEHELGLMSLALAHRGADDQGHHVSGPASLGCRRLAILDAAGGRQPLCNEDGTLWIVLDGEIYNYRQLRQGLADKGHVFRTRTDTEVIVHLYEELGEDCVSQLRGMFAFAIWDGRKRQLLLARDHLGQKPIFFREDKEGISFASEIKALTAVSRSPIEIDFDSLQHYLSLRYFPAPGTIVKGIHKIPPGSRLVYRDDSATISTYWKPTFGEKTADDESSLVEELRERLRETVAAHLTGDAPIGAFLSSGLDSGLIVAMMSRTMPGRFPTFTVGTRDSEFNEIPLARLVSKRFGTEQFETWAEADLIQVLPKMIHCLDEPSDPVAAAKYLAARLAADHVKVVLGGDGGDELFAGFQRYSAVRRIELFARIPRYLRRGVLHPLIERIPASYGYDSIAQKLRWVDEVSRHSGFADRFGQAVCFFRFDHQRKKDLFTEDVWRRVADLDSASLLAAKCLECDAEDPIDRMVYADYVWRLPEHSLMLTDRLSMVHGVEVRSPLVDRHLVEFGGRLPTSVKLRGRKRKYIQRKVAESELPHELTGQKKRGFRFPLAAWFGGELQPMLRRVLLSSPLVRDGIFRRDAILLQIDEHRRRQVDHHVRLWMLLNLHVWYELRIRGRTPDEVSESLSPDGRPRGSRAADPRVGG